ncbi:hypothetical protein WN943_024511 [Citrus x changshan-huyou]|nr:hypothetical protein CUMW_185510 [Citrus unshiu]
MGICGVTGDLPNSLGYLKNLRYLGLWGNSFVGSIPPSIGNLTFLKELHLSSNQMNGFPESFGQLSAIEVLDLDENQCVRTQVRMEENSYLSNKN